MNGAETKPHPVSWAATHIGAVAQVNPPSSTVTVDDDQLVTFLPMAAVEELSGRIDLSDRRRFKAVKKGFTRFRDGDLLFAKITPSMENGKIAVVQELADGVGCGSTEFHVIRPATGVEADYLRYYIVRSAFRQEAKRNMQGAVGQQRVPPDFIRDAHLPLAPSNEQKRIVSRIEELFGRIREGEHALQVVHNLVKSYRQSVLKAAVTGELTREWREKHKSELESGDTLLQRILKSHREAWETAELDKMKAKGERPANGNWKARYQGLGTFVTDYLGTLPHEWQRVRIDAGGEIQLGRQRAPQHHEGQFMRPYLRVANVFEERIDTGDVMTMNFTPDEFQSYALRTGDILLNEGQSKELVGRPAIYRDELPGVCFTNTLVRFRATAAVLPEFALLVFLHYMKSGYFQKIAKITTNIAHLGAGRFAEMTFPVPALEEQKEIVDRVDKQTSIYSHLVEDVAERKKQVSDLRQSVLRNAFAGVLVAQDHNDEPASMLLERIAAERDAPTAARRKHGPKKRTAA